MKLFLFLINIFSIFGLILTSTLEEECEVFYSMYGEDKKDISYCCSSFTDLTENGKGIVFENNCENGHITKM